MLKNLYVKALPFQVIDFPEGVILKRGFEKIVVNGSGALQKVLIILSFTSGRTASLEEICNQFAVPDRDGVEALIKDLLERSFLIHADQNLVGSNGNQFDIFLEQFKLSQKNLVEKLSALKIFIVGYNSLSLTILNCLNDLGVDCISIVDEPTLRNYKYFDADGNVIKPLNDESNKQIISLDEFVSKNKENSTEFLISCSEFGGQALLLKWNTYCVENHIDFMPVYLQDMIGYTSLMIPGETACLQCLRTRQNSHLRDLDIRDLIETNATNAQSVTAIHPAAMSILANTAFFEITHYYGRMPFPRPGKLIRTDVIASETEGKKILKVPRCKTCSSINRKAEVQINLMHPMPDK